MAARIILVAVNGPEEAGPAAAPDDADSAAGRHGMPHNKRGDAVAFSQRNFGCGAAHRDRRELLHHCRITGMAALVAMPLGREQRPALAPCRAALEAGQEASYGFLTLPIFQTVFLFFAHL